jgi:hypothetical protein
MKLTLWYESHNPPQREVARRVAKQFPQTRLVDVSTTAQFRETPSERGWPDRHVRAFPCLAFDSDDGEVELERVEEVLTEKAVLEAAARAKAHEKRVKTALKEAEKANVPGGGRPVRVAELRASGDLDARRS